MMNSKMYLKVLALVMTTFFLGACATSQPQSKFRSGSALSKNLFVDSSQFANKKVKLRLRNSSGDPSLNVSYIRNEISQGLSQAGYTLTEGDDFGILLDLNAYQFESISSARNGNNSNAIGALLGGVAGYEGAKRPGGLSSGSGVIIGTIAGATLQEVLRYANETSTFILVADVNVGVKKKNNTERDYFVVGGNRIADEPKIEDQTFASFALKDTVKVMVYAGDEATNRSSTITSLEQRLGRIVANML